MIKFICEECQEELRGRPGHSGLCPCCGTMIEVPELDEEYCKKHDLYSCWLCPVSVSG